MNRSTQPVRFTLVLFVIIAALCVLLAACADGDATQPAAPHTATLAENIVLGPLCPANPLDSIGIRHNRILQECFRQLVTDSGTGDATVPSLRQALQQAASLYGSDMQALVDSGWALARSLTPETAASLLPATLPPVEREALEDIIEAVVTNGTAMEQKAALCELEGAMVSQGWPLGDGTGNTALAAVSVAKHSCYFWNWVMGADGLERQLAATEKSVSDVVILADFIAFATVAGSSFSPNDPGIGNRVVSGLVAAGAASAFVAVLEHSKTVVGFFKRLFS